ncbi:MAG: flavodoxin domain-containing protein [Candidatus Cloacimonetes bacterium]|nr:flavodoxin domain-containing protein [Candidatus Cloacimonadota bacterium]
MSDKKILLAFYSGAGSTRTVAEVLQIRLQDCGYKIDLLDIDVETDTGNIEQYDFLIIGTPTHHCYPPKTISEFVDKIAYQPEPKNIFLFATYGLYVGNNLRMIAKSLLGKNIRTVGFAGFRSPAADASLMFPTFIKMMYKYESNIKDKIINTVAEIDRLIQTGNPKVKIPFYKWYAPLDWFPNKFYTARKFDRDFIPNIRLVSDRWNGEEIDCPRNCWEMVDNKPKYRKDNCEFCLRCVHRTPNKAVIYSADMQDRQRLGIEFFNQLKKELL